MKRTLSIILSLVLMIGAIAFSNTVVCAETIVVSGGNNKSSAVDINYSVQYGVSLAESGTKYFKFKTCDTDNYWYNISAQDISVGNNNGHSGIAVRICDSFDEEFAYADSFNSSIGVGGAKLEKNTIYYIAVFGCRAGNIKFKIDAVYDPYGETKEEAAAIDLGQEYQETIATPSGISENRAEDKKSGDVDYVKFNTGSFSKIKLTLTNGNVRYYNSYFEGICVVIYDSFGKSYCYMEVRPDSQGTADIELEKNTTYYGKFFATSDGYGDYKFKIAGFSLGDIDIDGHSTAADALLALQAATGKIDLDETATTAADVDSTPGVTANDALLILQYATQKIGTFPIESKIG